VAECGHCEQKATKITIGLDQNSPPSRLVGPVNHEQYSTWKLRDRSRNLAAFWLRPFVRGKQARTVSGQSPNSQALIDAPSPRGQSPQFEASAFLPQLFGQIRNQKNPDPHPLKSEDPACMPKFEITTRCESGL